MSHQAIPGPHISQSFARFCFDIDQSGFNIERDGYGFFNLPFEARKFRLFGKQDTIDVEQLESCVANLLHGDLQHPVGASISVLVRCIRKQFANVPVAGGAQNGIGNRMQQDVGIAMPLQLPVKRDRNPPDPQRAAGNESMRIVSDSDSEVGGIHGLFDVLPWNGIIMSILYWQYLNLPNLKSPNLKSPMRTGYGTGNHASIMRVPTKTRFEHRMAIIEIENLSKSYRVYQKQEGVIASIRGLFKRSYRAIHAVRNIDLTVHKGEFVAFLGPNGAGKTTTLKLLSGVINPDSGRCTVMGYVPWERTNEYRRRFALVMGQKNQLWWDLPAMESFRLHQHIYGIEASVFQRTCDELSEMLDVKRLLRQPVRELSLGERMKMELIAALLHSPDVLFLDEPTIGLDVVAQHRIQLFLREYQRTKNNTIILTSHYMKDIAALCKRVVIIAAGSIYHDGSLEQIVDQFSSDKLVTLQVSEGESLDRLRKLPNVVSVEEPRIQFRVARDDVARTLSDILGSHTVVDIVVEDPPLEEVIADVFNQAQAVNPNNQNETVGTR